MAFTTVQLESHLHRCGYEGQRLRKDYVYTDGTRRQHVSLAAFAYQSCDARDACVGAEDLPPGRDADAEALVRTNQGLGAPVFFLCRDNCLEWWSQKIAGPTLTERIPANGIDAFFRKRGKELHPEKIYRAKTLGRIVPQCQLSFVDVGLMPVLEERMGQEVARLVKRMIDALSTGLGKPKMDQTTARWLFQAAFWLLGAKVLKDKQVREFVATDINDVPTVLQLIAKHYGAQQPLSHSSAGEVRALGAAADIVKSFSSLENLTVESLAHVYENTLIDKPTRKALGIHATPSYLVDYIVWQLFDWIQNIPEKNRYVLEPTCGHAPFLVAAARLLRELVDERDPRKRHSYLKKHLIGVETDGFAREVARLSLTLADIPSPNGWHLEPADVYVDQTLVAIAKKATILLCNPPFQNFAKSEKTHYNGIRFHNKATELLARTLPHMPDQSVFGIIVPRGFLQAANAKPLRESLLKDFDIREIVVLPDNVFPSADHESAVILGRKNGRRTRATRVSFKWVREKTLDQFKASYCAPKESVRQSYFSEDEDYRLLVPELSSIWQYCKSLSSLSELATGGQGFSHVGEAATKGTIRVSNCEFPGGIPGFASFEEEVRLTGLPRESYLNLDQRVVARKRWGTVTGIPQIIMNYSPVSRGPWRIKALIDAKGHPVTSSFLVFRSKQHDMTIELLWAFLNSPLSNAYAYCNGTKRVIGADVMRSLPLPSCPISAMSGLQSLVQDFFDLYSRDGRTLKRHAEAQFAAERLLAIDTEVMRLYDLPPKLERQLLDVFAGWERPGVDFAFARYFPEDFNAYIPLHEYVSEEFQRSTVGFVRDWVDRVRSPELIRALETARESFEEERDAGLSS